MNARNAVRALTLISVCSLAGPALAQQPSQRELLERLQKLEQNQTKLYEMLKAKDARLDQLEAELQRATQAPPASAESAAQPASSSEGPPTSPEAPPSSAGALATTKPAPPAPPRYFGTYTPGRGFGIARNEFGEVTFGVYTYVRYLNQNGLDDHYVNGLGTSVHIDQRNDVELNKAKIEFRGWLIDPNFRWVFYTWTNNAAQGQGAQVVVAGNMTYHIDDGLTVGAGVASLPSTRSTQGNFPNWLSVDHRTAADEFFRGSYTMGVFATGAPLPGVGYYAMLGNNLSQLGVDAGQMDGDFTTVSTALWWMPTTGEFGPKSAFGDYEAHEDLATRLGGHFTFSPEDRQSQPGTEDIDNSQIRLSNGTVIFTPGALAPGVAVKSVKYYMAAFDAGLKWHGFALEGEYYLRWLNDFRANGPLPDHNFFDHGFQIMASMMLIPSTLQVYTEGALIFGEFGDPYEITSGLNWWVFRRRELRLNLEHIYEHRSPVGYTSIPMALGGTGSVVDLNLELNF